MQIINKHPYLYISKFDLTEAYKNVKKAFRKIIHKDNVIIVIDDFTLLSSDNAKLRWFFNGDLLLTNNKFTISCNNSILKGEVSTKNHSNLICSSSYFSDEGCMDRANKKLPPTQYPYMQFNSSKILHHVFHTTFHFSKIE